MYCRLMKSNQCISISQKSKRSSNIDKYSRICIEKRKIQAKYYGAYPIVNNKFKIDEYDDCLYASNTWCINALHFRKTGAIKYDVVTFDFTVTKWKQDIKHRYSKVCEFFKQMKNKVEEEELSNYNFHHIIAIPDKFLEDLQTINPQLQTSEFKISFSPIKKLQCTFQMNQLDTFTRCKFKLVKQRIIKSLQNVKSSQ